MEVKCLAPKTESLWSCASQTTSRLSIQNLPQENRHANEKKLRKDIPTHCEIMDIPYICGLEVRNWTHLDHLKIQDI